MANKKAQEYRTRYYVVSLSGGRSHKSWTKWWAFAHGELKGAETDFTGHSNLLIIKHHIPPETFVPYFESSVPKGAAGSTSIEELTAQSCNSDPLHAGYRETVHSYYKDLVTIG